jgi:ribosome-binding ATPase YchF (GTP1/OBG family)
MLARGDEHPRRRLHHTHSSKANRVLFLPSVTTKPIIYVVNLSSKNYIRKGSKWLPKINEWVKSHGGGQIIPISCDFEQTLFDMKDDVEGQKGMPR